MNTIGGFGSRWITEQGTYADVSRVVLNMDGGGEITVRFNPAYMFGEHAIHSATFPLRLWSGVVKAWRQI